MAQYPHFSVKSNLLNPDMIEMLTNGYVNKYDSTERNWMLQSKCIQFQKCYYYKKVTTAQLLNDPIIINIGVLSKDNIGVLSKGNFYIILYFIVLLFYLL